jgi:putative protease
LNNRKIELLAPARDLETGRVAVDCGADAVYIGGPGFGARQAAGNSPQDIAALVDYARPFGVRVYATLNTLLFDDELDEARNLVRALIEAGVDALIVQDMAWVRLVADLGFADKIELHASTQTSNMRPDDVAFLGRAGFRRVILERAMSLDEIRAVRAACPESVEIEAFVHGAICVAYSGRCFFSRSTGDGSRSGNRGDCSQPCRLEYDLVGGDGEVIVKGRHLLSVRDLDLSARLGELLDAGVSSLKIEGRLKDAAYVRNIVSHYRRLIDNELATRQHLRRASVGVSTPDFVPDPAKSFTRGGTDYFLDGPTGGVASIDTPKAMGEPVGRVDRTGCERTGNRFFTLTGPPNCGQRGASGGSESRGNSTPPLATGKSPLATGDGICFFADGRLRGTSVNRVEGPRIYPNRIDGIAPGTELFRNLDRAFVRALAGSRMRRRIGVSARVAMSESRVEVGFTDETGLTVTVLREGEFPEARDTTKMLSVVREQLSRSGDTIFDVGEVSFEGGIRFVPVSLLAAMRREGLSQLLEARRQIAPLRNPATEDPAAQFPRTRIEATENVTNRIAESFYRAHGVTEIAPAMELHGATEGEEVMRTRYCIRRETGECLRRQGRHNSLPADLFLVRGRERWRLEFDCERCEMSVIKA